MSRPRIISAPEKHAQIDKNQETFISTNIEPEIDENYFLKFTKPTKSILMKSHKDNKEFKSAIASTRSVALSDSKSYFKEEKSFSLSKISSNQSEKNTKEIKKELTKGKSFIHFQEKHNPRGDESFIFRERIKKYHPPTIRGAAISDKLYNLSLNGKLFKIEKQEFKLFCLGLSYHLALSRFFEEIITSFCGKEKLEYAEVILVFKKLGILDKKENILDVEELDDFLDYWELDDGYFSTDLILRTIVESVDHHNTRPIDLFLRSRLIAHFANKKPCLKSRRFKRRFQT